MRIEGPTERRRKEIRWIRFFKRTFIISASLLVVAFVTAVVFPVFASAQAAARTTTEMSHLKELGVVFGLYTEDNNDHFPFTSSPSKGTVWPFRCESYFKDRAALHSSYDDSKRWTTALDPPEVDTPAENPRWEYRWTSYLVNGYLSPSYPGKKSFVTISSIHSPGNTILLGLADDDTEPRDSFLPYTWGKPPEFASKIPTWDTRDDRTKELKTSRQGYNSGSNYLYADGRAKFGQWDRIWWRHLTHGIYAGDFDPRNEGRAQ